MYQLTDLWLAEPRRFRHRRLSGEEVDGGVFDVHGEGWDGGEGGDHILQGVSPHQQQLLGGGLVGDRGDGILQSGQPAQPNYWLIYLLKETNQNTQEVKKNAI